MLLLSEDLPVLIETLWNVKLRETWGKVWYGTSINRNIVECKAGTLDLAKVKATPY